MLKRIRERNLHFFALAFLTGLFLGINFSFIASANEPAYKYLDYFHRVYQIIKTDSVDLPSNKKIFYGAIRGMIKSLEDPFSRFLDERAKSELREMTTGKFVGVGIVITVRDEEVVVISPMDDTPAMRAGIKAGDIIARVNKDAIKGLKLSEIVKMIKGLPGSKVKLYVRRAGHNELLEFEIKRAPIKVKSVEYEVIKDTDIGYIKVKNFGFDTTRDVEKALKYFNKKNLNKVIVDLRYNPGGLLNASVKISDLFLTKGQIVVSTRGRKDSGNEKVFKSENDPVYKEKLLVLVNRGSASASEIFSGAIRDNKRGKLLGDKTFGKGSVQKTFNLDKKVGVAITIARYYTPSGELIHKKGIAPDYKVPLEKLSERERKNVKRIDKELLDKFIKKGMAYNKETRKQFYEFLKENRMLLSEKTANYILKNRLNRYKKQPMYDLEFDNQLSAAIQKLNKMN